MLLLAAPLYATILSAVVVFIVSSLIHMMLPWHKNDFAAIPDENAFRNAVRGLNIPDGDYMVPRPGSRDAMRSPEFMAKVREGPNVIMTVFRYESSSMGKSLTLWFLYILVVTWFAGHIAFRVLANPSDGYMVVHTVGGAAFAGYVMALWQMSIWYRRSWRTTALMTLDGLIYAAITAGIFYWLWPR